ncbi:hypothetical protein Ocin01_00702 [Orchesella cincta]|uniref:Uncharacterized protein n=1 Tax=Orchesella cincta TaxID=48709 RepID=A0A1D2NL59_ORCCI|nr:hypothetical protein Ocin01_00702 [Orchesella cincta]
MNALPLLLKDIKMTQTFSAEKLLCEINKCKEALNTRDASHGVASLEDLQCKSHNGKPLSPIPKLYRPTASAAILHYLNDADACIGEYPSVANAFVWRDYNGKIVRDVCVDTHDLINETGGFIMNFSRHGATQSKDLRIHLGIREKKLSKEGNRVLPGTINTTDDYAREVFKGIKLMPGLETVSAVLEIDDREDCYDFKKCQLVCSDFLRQFIQTCPTTLTKLHVEIPFLSAVYLPEWKFLLDQQTSLKVLICNFGAIIWTFYESCISQNSKTLERVILRRLQTYNLPTARYIPFDWGIFSDCPKLNFLKITCGYRTTPAFHYEAPAPTTVFLHENLLKLPGSLQEVHFSKIWVEPCMLRDFCNARPEIKVCSNCHDMEYYDADIPESAVGENGNYGQVWTVRGMKLVTVSSLDVTEQYWIPGREMPKKRTDDQQFSTIVLSLFQVILVALVLLFIIIYFGHWRSQSTPPDVTPGPDTILEIVHDVA